MTPRFLLKDKNEAETIVYMVVHINGQRLKYSTGKKINPVIWNATKQRMFERAGLPYRNFNAILDALVTKVNEIILAFDASGKIATVTNVKFALQNSSGRNTADFATVNDYMAHYIKNAVKNHAKSVRFFDVAVQKLNEFNSHLHWADMNEITYRRFILWMEKKGYSNNYIGSMASKQRIILNSAVKDGYLRGTDYHAWRRKSEEVYKIYLTEAEIETLYTAKLKGYMEKARDLFIIGCCTGLRVGNYLNIDPKIQISGNYINAIVNKNGPRVMIPIHWMVAEILEKYKGLPESISEQKLNKYIKDVCAEVGISSPVQWHRTEGGKRVIHSDTKHRLVTSHTARRSFATNLYLRGENPTVIMAVTGHSNTKMFFKYIKITHEDSSRKLALSGFFKKPD